MEQNNNELNKIRLSISYIQKGLKRDNVPQLFIYKSIDKLYNHLYKVSELSDDIYNKRDSIMNNSILESSVSEKKPDNIFYDKYFSLTKPYDSLKSIIWKLIFKLKYNQSI